MLDHKFVLVVAVEGDAALHPQTGHVQLSAESLQQSGLATAGRPQQKREAALQPIRHITFAPKTPDLRSGGCQYTLMLPRVAEVL